ncbi:serine aminopeptidase domain-containing protein [Streptomyces griseus]|uniref:serine aminopeptidase domain-containing protein n=1 Tax=Streptomyces griseus TaxID=1911 RepID=UPI00083FF44D|nr:alpha/beta hydrolase [Streptomyces griseus]
MLRNAIATLGILALAAGAAGCGLTTPTPDTRQTQPRPQAAPQPDHTQDTTFYDYPDQALIDRTAPGGILKSQPLQAPASSLLGSAASRAERIMYRTADERGRPVAATGVLLLPKAAPKDADGWPIISWAHGTTGVGPECAPSRSAQLGGTVPLLVKWLREGYAIAAADYPGLGPNGKVHGYLHLRAEGRSVAHAALAAHNAYRNTVSKKWFAVGISQGGQAALGAGEWAAQAKGMRFLGTAALAPAAHHAAALRSAVAEQSSGASLEGLRNLFSYIAVGAHVYDPKKFAYEDLLTPELAEEIARPAVRNLCLDELDGYLKIFAPEKKTHGTLNPDWETRNPEISTFLDSVNPAQKTSAGPVLVLQGEADPVVSPAGTRQLITELCAKDDSVDWKTYPGVGHADVAIAGLDDLRTWMNDRLRSTPPNDRCRPAGSSPAQGK